MRRGLIGKVVSAYAAMLPRDWRRSRHEFLRRKGSWIHVLSFNCSRFADTYVPRSAMEFLNMPGEFTAGFLVQELLEPRHRTQRWVSWREHEGGIERVFSAMQEQLRPSIVKPLEETSIELLLLDKVDYWPHAYALSVMRAQEGDRQGASRFYEVFRRQTSDKPYNWVADRRRELDVCIELSGDENRLNAHLATIAAEKLRKIPGS